MKVSKTRDQVTEFLRETTGVAFPLRADRLAGLLDIEYSPEPPRLPEWFGEEECDIDDLGPDEYFTSVPGDGMVMLAEDLYRAYAEGYNRFVRMKRRLEEYPETCGVVCKGHDAAVEALRIARGEEASS